MVFKGKNFFFNFQATTWWLSGQILSLKIRALHFLPGLKNSSGNLFPIRAAVLLTNSFFSLSIFYHQALSVLVLSFYQLESLFYLYCKLQLLLHFTSDFQNRRWLLHAYLHAWSLVRAKEFCLDFVFSASPGTRLSAVGESLRRSVDLIAFCLISQEGLILFSLCWVMS